MSGDYKEFICTKCDYVGPKAKVKPGSSKLEIILWLTFIIPGPFYSLWRILAKKNGCPKCSTTVMVQKKNELEDEDISLESLSKITSILKNDKRDIKVDDFVNAEQPAKITSNIDQHEAEEEPTNKKENRKKQEDW